MSLDQFKPILQIMSISCRIKFTLNIVTLAPAQPCPCCHVNGVCCYVKAVRYVNTDYVSDQIPVVEIIPDEDLELHAQR